MIAAAALPLLGVAVAARAERPEVEQAPHDTGDGVLAGVLVPGVGLMLVNCGYVAFLAFGGSVAGTALMVPLFAAGVIVVRTFGARLPDRWGGRRTLAASTAVAAIGLAVIAAGGATAIAVAGTLLLAAGQGLGVPALGLLALANVPPERHGAAAGLFFAFFDAGVGLGGPLTGAVARATSPEGALLAAAGAVAAAGLVATRPSRTGRGFPSL
jgi:predicted MFS family arabinose efflux permease